MTYTITQQPPTDEQRALSTLFAKHFRAYMEASDEVQDVIESMSNILNDPDADPDEKVAALDTLTEALFPASHNGQLGIDIDDLRSVQPKEIKDECAKHDAQEESFAYRLADLMQKREINQAQLASMIDVQQPAISMMLARNCRPQRRTIEKLAKALRVKPKDLWTDFSD